MGQWFGYQVQKHELRNTLFMFGESRRCLLDSDQKNIDNCYHKANLIQWGLSKQLRAQPHTRGKEYIGLGLILMVV